VRSVYTLDGFYTKAQNSGGLWVRVGIKDRFTLCLGAGVGVRV
jgi:hypothetical protein